MFHKYTQKRAQRGLFFFFWTNANTLSVEHFLYLSALSVFTLTCAPQALQQCTGKGGKKENPPPPLTPAAFDAAPSNEGISTLKIASN